jgi:hypothetical protein
MPEASPVLTPTSCPGYFDHSSDRGPQLERFRRLESARWAKAAEALAACFRLCPRGPQLQLLDSAFDMGQGWAKTEFPPCANTDAGAAFAYPTVIAIGREC